MNDIVYSGCLRRGVQADKYLRIILPDGEGELVSPYAKLNYDKGDFIVIPPTFACRVSVQNGCEIDIEKALLPYREAKVFKDFNGGIAFCALQSSAINKNKERAVFSALGNLAVAYCCDRYVSKSYSPVVNSLTAEIENRLSDATFSLETYISNLPLNYEYVRKLFKKETGATPHGYLVLKRMELAKNILESGAANKFSRYTVSQVAEACGFSDPLYFSRAFKKYYGVSPSEFIK